MTDRHLVTPAMTERIAVLLHTAKISPSQTGERWLLHLTRHSRNTDTPQTTTLTVCWSGQYWQLQGATNAGDWPDMHHAFNEVCFNLSQQHYWYCEGGPLATEQMPLIFDRWQAEFLSQYHPEQVSIRCEPLPSRIEARQEHSVNTPMR